MRAWGFEPVTGMPWIKTYDPPTIDLFGELRYRPTWGMGAWVRGCSEPILIGKRGNAKPPEKKRNRPTFESRAVFAFGIYYCLSKPTDGITGGCFIAASYG
jgi:N6-adenosine-specific RNA methylase IME4